VLSVVPLGIGRLQTICDPGSWAQVCGVANIIGDEDISTILPLITKDDDAKIHDTNEIRIGPITRARAKLLN
jgi:hypothetical protein